MPTDADAEAALRIVDSMRAAFPAEAASIVTTFRQVQLNCHLRLHRFGSPSFVHGEGAFRGDDRLEDAIDRALQQHTA